MRFSALMAAFMATTASSLVWAGTSKPDWVGIWRGTIGKLPVQACFQARDYGSYGAYFYLKHLGIISLGGLADGVSAGATNVWTEARNSDHPEVGPLWKNLSVTATELTGTWTGNGKELPIVLTRVAQTDPSEEPCGDLAFSKPRVTPVQLANSRATVDGVDYTIVKADVGKQFPDVSLETFQLDGNTGAVQNINAALKAEIQEKVEKANFFECTMANLAAMGEDGQYQTSTKPVLITTNWMVSATDAGSTCGGAHPNWSQSWTNWDLRTGAAVDLWTWLGPIGATVTPRDGYNEVTIESELRALLGKGWQPAETDCKDVIEGQEYWSVRLTRTGFAFSPDLPHAQTPCIDDVNLTFDQLAPLLNADGASRVASFREDLK
jgi:hypothetical protein